jgi:Protein of unknown function (DUF1566)
MTRRQLRDAARAAVVFWLLANGSALAAASEQTCQFARAKAAVKYNSCIKKALAKGWMPSGFDSLKMSKCRQKYDATWTKLQAMTGTSCDAARWVDNGNGTVTDNLSGLQWEKKDDLGGIHDKDNTYTWTTSVDGNTTDADGTAFTSFLAGLNSPTCFAGQCDWRLPTFAEIHTLLLPELYPCTTSPCIAGLFGPTQPARYWTSTSIGSPPSGSAWNLYFDDGLTDGSPKSNGFYVRAVHGDE